MKKSVGLDELWQPTIDARLSRISRNRAALLRTGWIGKRSVRQLQPDCRLTAAAGDR